LAVSAAANEQSQDKAAPAISIRASMGDVKEVNDSTTGAGNEAGERDTMDGLALAAESEGNTANETGGSSLSMPVLKSTQSTPLLMLTQSE